MKDKLEQLDQLIHDMQMDEHQNEGLSPKLGKCRGIIHDALKNMDSSSKLVIDPRKLLCDFFKFFRDNGEANIGMTIEQFVDGYLKQILWQREEQK